MESHVIILFLKSACRNLERAEASLLPGMVDAPTALDEVTWVRELLTAMQAELEA